ncbi:MAG: hypothetical protein HY829_11175 [Actinobacteria bacterium]|nr:hypothetical protein [Actinomycetota bacterium]
MFENHVMQMYDTREIEMRARLGQVRVELVPPFRSTGDGLVAHLMAGVRSLLRRVRAEGSRGAAQAPRPAVRSVPCP